MTGFDTMWLSLSKFHGEFENATSAIASEAEHRVLRPEATLPWSPEPLPKLDLPREAGQRLTVMPLPERPSSPTAVGELRYPCGAWSRRLQGGRSVVRPNGVSWRAYSGV